MSNALQDKICVVTGATRGIGRGWCQVSQEKGATVFVTGRSDGDGELTITRDRRRHRSRWKGLALE